jgi:hypothetical protein
MIDFEKMASGEELDKRIYSKLEAIFDEEGFDEIYRLIHTLAYALVVCHYIAYNGDEKTKEDMFMTWIKSNDYMKVLGHRFMSSKLKHDDSSS